MGFWVSQSGLGFQNWGRGTLSRGYRAYMGVIGLGFPKIGDTFSGVPVIRIVVFWGLYCGAPI